MSVAYLQPVEVKAMLKGPDRDKVLVVDVREDDFAGGHIAGCVHFPVDRWGSDYELDAFIEERVGSRSDLETVVVHCYLSQQRGPFCAHRLVSRLQALRIKGPQVCILSHGFRRFKQLYGDDPELVEDDEEREESTEESTDESTEGDEGTGRAAT